jgi:hypothetical protein
MESNDHEEELTWADVCEGGSLVKRLGRSISTGLILIECKLDEKGREIEKNFFDDDGQLHKRIVYEHDEERQPRLTTGFDKSGKLIWQQERGKRPKTFPQ